MTPKQAATWLPVLLPLVGSLCTGVTIKVNIATNPPRERSKRLLEIYNALPEVAQDALANTEPWEAE